MNFKNFSTSMNCLTFKFSFLFKNLRQNDARNIIRQRKNQTLRLDVVIKKYLDSNY